MTEPKRDTPIDVTGGTLTPRDKPSVLPEGARYAPSYRAGSALSPNRCLIHEPDFTDEDPDLAARIGHDRRSETELFGLFWDGKVVIIPPAGIRCVPGLYGKVQVLWIQGPGFEHVQESERQLYAKIKGDVTPPARLTETDVKDA